MPHTDFAAMPCPIARTLARVGERWSMLILRDAFYGMTRFDEFRKSLDIAPNILTRRLAELVQAGLLEKRVYTSRPTRYEYVLTQQGRELRPIMLAMVAWGNRHFSPEGPALAVVARETGAPVEQCWLDTSTGQVLGLDGVTVMAGAGATPGLRERIALAARKHGESAADEAPHDPQDIQDPHDPEPTTAA